MTADDGVVFTFTVSTFMKVVLCSVDNIIYNLVFRKNGRFEGKNCPVGRRTETGEV